MKVNINRLKKDTTKQKHYKKKLYKTEKAIICIQPKQRSY